jgi:hypothetical protein
MKMAALTMFTADEDRRTAVLVIPWFGTPPPQSAASMISPPYLLTVLNPAFIDGSSFTNIPASTQQAQS